MRASVQQYSHPNLFRRRERTARFWPPPRPHGTDVAEVHTAGSHSRLRSQRMMAFGTPYQHTSQAISPAPPLRQLAGKTMLLVLQLLRRKPHGGAGAMVLNVECALQSPSLVWRSALMPVHGPTALQAKLKLEGRSVLTCGSLGRCRSVGAVMLTSLELGEMVTDRV